MKIDAFCHILPRAYADAIEELDPSTAANIRARIAGVPSLVDLDLRFRQLDEFGDYRQIISLPAPAPEDLGSPTIARRMARLGNEGLAELVSRHPDRFAGFIAALPLNDMDGTLIEIDHAIGELGALGVQTYTHVNGHPFDEPQFEPLFARMAELDRMIWVHPNRNADWADYPSEQRSRYEVWWVFGWPYETTACMTRLIYSGIFDELPDLKLISHHMGGMIPYFAGKIGLGFRQIFFGTPEHNPLAEDLKHQPIAREPRLSQDVAHHLRKFGF